SNQKYKEKKKPMHIVYEKKTNKKLGEAIDSLTEQLKENGFGVLWQLNFKDKLKEKGLDFEEDFVVWKYVILKKQKKLWEKISISAMFYRVKWLLEKKIIRHILV